MKKRILLVMDDWERLEHFENRFCKSYEVFSSPFGEQGMDLAKEKNPDLILIDLSFENMDEREFQAQIRGNEVFSKIPLIFLSEPHGSWASLGTNDYAFRIGEERLSFFSDLEALLDSIVSEK